VPRRFRTEAVATTGPAIAIVIGTVPATVIAAVTADAVAVVTVPAEEVATSGPVIETVASVPRPHRVNLPVLLRPKAANRAAGQRCRSRTPLRT
jgi:hypothetical protein